eukprot:123505-Prorocentrum_minimum.AAC.7
MRNRTLIPFFDRRPIFPGSGRNPGQRKACFPPGKKFRGPGKRNAIKIFEIFGEKETRQRSKADRRWDL